MSLDHLDQAHPVAGAQAPDVGNLVHDQGRIRDVGQPGHPHAIGEVVSEASGHFHGETGLAGPTHPGEGDQPVGLEQGSYLLEVVTPPYERGELRREMNQIDRFGSQRLGYLGQIGMEQLEEALRALQVPEGMDPPVLQLHWGLDRFGGQLCRGSRHQYLPTVRRGHHAGRPVHIRPEVIAGPFIGGAGMDPNPDADRRPFPGFVEKTDLDLHRGAEGGQRRGECSGKRIPGAGEDVPTEISDGGFENAVVGDQARRHAVTVRFPEAGRTGDVAEQERDRAGGPGVHRRRVSGSHAGR